MSKSFTNSMFESIKESLNSQKNTGGGYRDLLRTKVGNSYIVRFIPNVKNPERTFYHYFFHGWKSLATGQYQEGLCPTTWGERCPICEETMKLWRGDDEDKKKARELKRNEKWLVNVYVVDDPDQDANNDTVKVLRYGKQIDSVVTEAMEGEDADEFGARIFDLSKEGCNLRIRVEKNEGGYPSYTKSKFLSKSEIDSVSDVKTVYEDMFELDKIFETKTYDELQQMLDDHYHCKTTSSSSSKAPVDGVNDEPDEDEVEESTTEAANTESEDSGEGESEIDDKLKDLIADLD